MSVFFRHALLRVPLRDFRSRSKLFGVEFKTGHVRFFRTCPTAGSASGLPPLKRWYVRHTTPLITRITPDPRSPSYKRVDQIPFSSTSFCWVAGIPFQKKWAMVLTENNNAEFRRWHSERKSAEKDSAQAQQEGAPGWTRTTIFAASHDGQSSAHPQCDALRTVDALRAVDRPRQRLAHKATGAVATFRARGDCPSGLFLAVAAATTKQSTSARHVLN